MKNGLAAFKRQKDFLICIDSDGCVMDTMDIKHIECFGPCMVTEWELEDNAIPILKRWNDINLYTMTRGINRFKGLSQALSEIDAMGTKIEDIASLQKWVSESDELSNNALEKAITKTESIALKKAMSWSIAVNEKINKLPSQAKKPFDGAKEGLKKAREFADVAIVSSANLQAVIEEWEMHGLLAHVDIVLAQDTGSKSYCIGELVKKGYKNYQMMMVGDAPGDFDAAEKNNIAYYPILVKKEKESWGEFGSFALEAFLKGSYQGKYQADKIEAFKVNLSEG